MKILIIEDEAVAARNLARMLASIDLPLQVVATQGSVRKAIAWLQINPEPDLVFMDVQLSDGLCFEIFEEVTLEAPIIFTTAFDQYALKAFDVNSVDYLLKPFSLERIELALSKMRRSGMKPGTNHLDIKTLVRAFGKQMPRFKSRFLVKVGKKLISLSVSEIGYFLKEDLVFLVTQSGKRYPVNYSLDELEIKLDPNQFFRLNRQVLASLESILEVNPFFKGKLMARLVPAMENQVVSQKRASKFKAWLDQ